MVNNAAELEKKRLIERFNRSIKRFIYASVGLFVCLSVISIFFVKYFEANWFVAIISLVSAAATSFLGLMVYWQNERFKIENDFTSEELLKINKRMLTLDENKEKAYITFDNSASIGTLGSFNTGIEQRIIFECENMNSIGSDILLRIKNQTDVPIKGIEIIDLKFVRTNKNTIVKSIIREYKKTVVIFSPNINKGEKFPCIFALQGIADLDSILIDNYVTIEINLIVTSIYDRNATQKFSLIIDYSHSSLALKCIELLAE